MSTTKRVARGVALLDEHRPGWERGINTVRLDMVDVNRCILGQLYGSFSAACGHFREQRLWLQVGPNSAFMPWTKRDAARLRAEWIRVIEHRLGFIGEEETQREIEFEPFPETAPVKEPTPATPAPAPAEPEKVPA